MSKFFKALEQAERERTRNEVAAPAGSPPSAQDGRETVPRTTVPDAIPTAEPSAPAEIPAEARSTDRARGVEDTAGDEREEMRAVVEVTPPLADTALAEDAGEAEPHLVSLHAPTSFAAEQYRTLRHIIEHEGVQMIAVTSPGVGDGKTTTAVNLAGALAQAPEARVLLIDCDLRRPTVGKFIGLPANQPAKGLVELLLDRRLPLDAAIVKRRTYNLDILPAGQPPVNPYEVLKSSRLPAIMEEVRKRYNFVILDTPPAIPLPDCRVLGNFVDAFVMIVSANRTPRRLVHETLETLDRRKVLGLIFNKDETPVGGYYEYQAYFPRNGNAGRSTLGRLVTRVRSLRRKPATGRKK